MSEDSPSFYASPHETPAKRRRQDDIGLSDGKLAVLILRLQADIEEYKKKTSSLEDTVAAQSNAIRELQVRATHPDPSPLSDPSTSNSPLKVTVDHPMDSSYSSLATAIPILEPNTISPLIDPPLTTSNTPDPSIPEPNHDLERSIVIARLPSDPSLSPLDSIHNDYKLVVQLTALTGFPALPVSVYRMPVRDPSAPDRLTKVVLPTRQHARLIIQNAHKISSDPFFSDVFMRPSFASHQDPRRKIAPAGSGIHGPFSSHNHPRPDPTTSAPLTTSNHRTQNARTYSSVASNQNTRAPHAITSTQPQNHANYTHVISHQPHFSSNPYPTNRYTRSRRPRNPPLPLSNRFEPLSNRSPPLHYRSSPPHYPSPPLHYPSPPLPSPPLNPIVNPPHSHYRSFPPVDYFPIHPHHQTYNPSYGSPFLAHISQYGCPINMGARGN